MTGAIKYDTIIFGAGFYGLYAARFLGQKGQKVLVLEKECGAFKRASYINQARVHMGYHYPRSITTALKSRNYFERFNRDFSDCINLEFRQIYATGKRFSWTSAYEFKCFCINANIPCEEIDAEDYFKKGVCDGAFLTTEYAYDAGMLRDRLLSDLDSLKSIDIRYHHRPTAIHNHGEEWVISCGKDNYCAPFVLNATYAGVNEVHELLQFEPFKLKFEKCEIILCNVNESLENLGITVMDGPFFSIMPFGKTGLHSLTSVNFTPHETSYETEPVYKCQMHEKCRPKDLLNCNECGSKPNTAWDYMSKLADKYINEKFKFVFNKSLFVIKPILQMSEVDDSRPTVIREMNQKPRFISILSGKINTVYDLEEVLKD